MDLDKAIALMHKMANDGSTQAEIAAELKRKGFKGPRTGKTLTPHNVGYYLRKDPPKAAAARPTPAETAKPSGDSPVSLLGLQTRVDLAIKLLTDDTWGTPEQRIIVGVNVLKGAGA